MYLCVYCNLQGPKWFEIPNEEAVPSFVRSRNKLHRTIGADLDTAIKSTALMQGIPISNLMPTEEIKKRQTRHLQNLHFGTNNHNTVQIEMPACHWQNLQSATDNHNTAPQTNNRPKLKLLFIRSM